MKVATTVINILDLALVATTMAVIWLQQANDDNDQSGFGPGGKNDDEKGFGPLRQRERRQDEYLSDPSIEDSIRLCGKYNTTSFDLGELVRQTDKVHDL